MLVAGRSECEFVRKFPLKYSRVHFGAEEPGKSIILAALVYCGRPSDVFDNETANFSARVADPSVPEFIRVMPTHDLNAILYPPSSENTVRCIGV